MSADFANFTEIQTPLLCRTRWHEAHHESCIVQRSNFSNRIELDGNHTNQYSLPLAKVFNKIPPEKAARVDLAQQEGLKIFRAANTTEVWNGDRIGIHELGGNPNG